MAQRVDYHAFEAAFSVLLDHGLDGADEALRILVNEASKIERTWFLNAKPHKRTHVGGGENPRLNGASGLL